MTTRRLVDPEDGGAEVADLWSAKTAKELHCVLVLHPSIRRSTNAFEPYLLFAKHHETEPATSVVTAMLLLTDRRWRDGVGQLARRIEASGVLDAEELDLLATAFVAADEAVFWEVPDEWFSDDVVMVVLDDTAVPVDEKPDGVAGPTVARRDVVPPLRRWAGARLVRRDPGRWRSLFARAGELDARSAAAVMSGVLDSIDCLEANVQAVMIHRATRWPEPGVRRLGLSLVAEREGVEAAYAIAKDDPNARIRAWAEAFVYSAPVRAPNVRPDPLLTSARRRTTLWCPCPR